MPRKRDLTYFGPRRCWKKKYRGKVYYVGPTDVAKSDVVAYQKALDEWRELRRRLDDEERRAEMDQIADTNRGRGLRADIAPLNVMAGEMAELGVTVAKSWTDRIEGMVRSAGLEGHPDFVIDPKIKECPTERSVRDCANAFLGYYQNLARSNRKSISRADNLRRYLNTFRSWRPRDGSPTVDQMTVRQIDASLVSDYFIYLAGCEAAGMMASQTANSTFNAFRQFVRWLWQREEISLPRNLDHNDFRFKLSGKQVQVYTSDQLASLYAAATDRVKLFMLLALNCGMTARDISDLHPKEVAWNKGSIIRQRSKTRGLGNDSPTVVYQLWPSTMKLLRALRSDNPDRVLIGENGNPLVHEMLKADGTGRRTDAIRLAFRRAVEKVNRNAAQNDEGTPRSPIKAEFTRLRRTSASLLRNKFDEALAEVWLAHSPKGVGERHYFAVYQERLDEAVYWLGKKLEMYESNQ